jgi:hypothetical protein
LTTIATNVSGEVSYGVTNHKMFITLLAACTSRRTKLRRGPRLKEDQSLANGAEGRSPTERNAIDWHEVKRTVSDQRQRIFRGELLEPCAVRVACTVLR